MAVEPHVCATFMRISTKYVKYPKNICIAAYVSPWKYPFLWGSWYLYKGVKPSPSFRAMCPMDFDPILKLASTKTFGSHSRAREQLKEKLMIICWVLNKYILTNKCLSDVKCWNGNAIRVEHNQVDKTWG